MVSSPALSYLCLRFSSLQLSANRARVGRRGKLRCRRHSRGRQHALDPLRRELPGRRAMLRDV